MQSSKRDMNKTGCYIALPGRFFVGLVFLCLIVNIQAGEVTVEFATSTLVNHSYQVNAYIDYK
ncbi:MAG: hypothetical protein ACI9SC_002543, partial [Gammaproteobacteria bacterium]